MFGFDYKGKKKTITDFNNMKLEGQKLAWITAYDYPLAQCAEAAGIDMILVGDSGGMVMLGYETTNPVTMDEMIVMAKAVRRGAPNTFVIGDMPQGSYEISCEEAVRSAMRFVKEAGCDAIKLEGGKRVADKIKAIVDAGIPVIGHLGLTPQSTSSFGGYRVQGKTIDEVKQIFKDANSIIESGIFALLLEAVPSESAEFISKKLSGLVYGIGAGPFVDGQLLIMHDLIGLYNSFRPKFAKCYIPQALKDIPIWEDDQKKDMKDGIGHIVINAIKEYIAEVKLREFPSEEYYYKLKDEELKKYIFELIGGK